MQHAFDGVAEPARLGLDGDAVALHPRRIADHAVGEIAGRRVDDRHRRAQLVGDGGDEFHLPAGQGLGAARRHGDERDDHAEQRQNTAAQAQVAPPRRRHGRFERAGGVFHAQRPVSVRMRDRARAHRAVAVAAAHLDHADHAAARLVRLDVRAR